MGKKETKQFICRSCGAIHSTWSGRCYNCGEWNTIEESVIISDGQKATGLVLKPTYLKQAVLTDQPRLVTGMDEVDTVLGGGWVRGSVNLLAGQPGAGKSTLLMQIAQTLSNKYKVLYVSGEESIHQVALRAKRLGVPSNENLSLASTTSADDIAATINKQLYDVVIVDSIQTVTTSASSAMAGSVGQIMNSTLLLTGAIKKSQTTLILVGHVTKEGSIAGPKVLEHLVDVVMQLEGDRYGGFKILRASKNRYGSILETGIFEMQDRGLVNVTNPSATLLAERQISDGSIVVATIEGTRPLLVEVQALVNKTSYGYPKRAASGVDLNRLNLLVAMLERRTKLNLSNDDIYVNVVGGLTLKEPAADLGIIMAVASAARGMQLKTDAVVFGEVGLSGEVRHVPHIEKRIAEAKKLGFKLCIGPGKKTSKDYHSVSNVREALNTFLQTAKN